MAEIRVPACPMPIHHTKLMMANPHATGLLIPQIPVPTTTSFRIETMSKIVRRNPIPSPTYQPRGVRWVKTTELILSVTDAKV
jgi:uncharacterized protein YifN (PemK superfamily)